MLALFSNKDPIRISAYREFCSQYGMYFAEKDEFGLKVQLKPFNIFHQHSSGRITNIAQGKAQDLTEQEFLFDYIYRVSTGKSSVTYKQSIYFLNSKLLALPYFKFKPEHFGHKIASLLGIEDIDFESYPVFSEKYYLKGEDESFIRATFDDNILKFFSLHHGWTCEAVNYYLIIYKFNSMPHGHEISKFYEVCKGISELFKVASADHLNVSLE